MVVSAIVNVRSMRFDLTEVPFDANVILRISRSRLEIVEFRVGFLFKGESRGFRGKVGDAWRTEFFFLMDKGSTVPGSPLGVAMIDGSIE